MRKLITDRSGIRLKISWWIGKLIKYRRCDACLGIIKYGASKCKHCGSTVAVWK